MKIIKKFTIPFILISFLAFFSLSGFSTTYAQRDCSGPFGPGTETELGCIPRNPESLAQWGLRFAVAVGGGFAFLLIILGAFKILVSQGDPKALQEGKDQITSAIMGLLLIIFAVVLLQFIGVRVLELPGWS
ncbi:MAG: hypothetical protein M1150_03745 [Patescibacteria group bacterium]|nr:hypothetical protein [Patescibacteria group bacterium]